MKMNKTDNLILIICLILFFPAILIAILFKFSVIMLIGGYIWCISEIIRKRIFIGGYVYTGKKAIISSLIALFIFIILSFILTGGIDVIYKIVNP